MLKNNNKNKLASLVIDDDSLSDYHRHYCALPFTDIKKRITEKDLELKTIFKKIKINTNSERIWIAVLGCADKRFIHLHRKMFQKYFEAPVEVVTFDITTEHLKGEEHIVKQDCTITLPHTIFDLTYSHVLFKFIQPERQWSALKNSFDALKKGGMAIHIFDTGDYSTTERLQRTGYFSVPLKELERKMKNHKIKYEKIEIEHGIALVLNK